MSRDEPPVGEVKSDRWIRDPSGAIVVFQRPNLPLVVWMIARLLETFVDRGRPARLLDAIAFGALFTWSWLELFQGSAYIRRILGVGVLAAVVLGRVRV